MLVIKSSAGKQSIASISVTVLQVSRARLTSVHGSQWAPLTGGRLQTCTPGWARVAASGSTLLRANSVGPLGITGELRWRLLDCTCAATACPSPSGRYPKASLGKAPDAERHCALVDEDCQTYDI